MGLCDDSFLVGELGDVNPNHEDRGGCVLQDKGIQSKIHLVPNAKELRPSLKILCNE